MQFILQHKNCRPIFVDSNAVAKCLFPGGGQTKGDLQRVSGDLRGDQRVIVFQLQMMKCTLVHIAEQYSRHSFKGRFFAAYSIENTCRIGAFILICSFIEQA